MVSPIICRPRQTCKATSDLTQTRFNLSLRAISRVPALICHCEERPLIPSPSRDVAISMRLNTRRRTAFATATGLPRCARNDNVGTRTRLPTNPMGFGLSALRSMNRRHDRRNTAGDRRSGFQLSAEMPGEMRERRNAGRARSKGPAPNHPFILSLSKHHPEPVERSPRTRRGPPLMLRQARH